MSACSWSTSYLQVYLSELIAAEDGDEDSADSERFWSFSFFGRFELNVCHRCVWGQGVGDFNTSATSDGGQCVWGALEQHAQATAPEATTAVRRNNHESLECSPQKRVASDALKRPRIFDGRERRLEEREAKKKRQDESAAREVIINTEDEVIDSNDIRQSRRIQQWNSTPEHSSNTEPNVDDLSKRDQLGSSENRLQNDSNNYLASLDESLTNLIPAEELEEMMNEDFLFCGGGIISTARQEEKAEEVAVPPLSMSQVSRKEDFAPSRRRESTTTPRRRSARLSVHTNLTGSIFLPIPSSPTCPLLPSASLTAVKAVDAIDSKTPIVGSPDVVKSAAATPLFNNTLAPPRVVNKAKTKSRLGKEMQKALGDLTSLETKEGRLLKGRAATRSNRGRRGVPLAENSRPQSREEGKHKKKQPLKEPRAGLSAKQLHRGSLGELTDRRSKEGRPRSGEGGSRRSR